MLDLSSAPKTDPEKPCFHVMPRTGWINDPNSPLYFNGKYHLFYQHIVNGCEWDFGIVWGHSVSSDLIHWEHMPPALIPSEGGHDADGCFSGCGVVDTNGVPTILYTGVRLRSNPGCGPLPPPECDLNLPFIESQLIAIPDEGDTNLVAWTKQEQPFLGLPPADMPLVGWRDPFIFEFKGQDGFQEWGMLLGSGIKGQGGSIMIYRSSELTGGWRYESMLCEADNVDTGVMWECPLLLELQQAPTLPWQHSVRGVGSLRTIMDSHTALGNGNSPTEGWPTTLDSIKEARNQGAETDKAVERDPANRPEPPQQRGTAGAGLLTRQLSSSVSNDSSRESSMGLGSAPQPQFTHFLCVSPDAPTNPVLYWVGNFDAKNTRFLLEGAHGPTKLDLGDVLYAPNLMKDAKGRHVLWGWLQERRKVGSYDYAGCLSVPRLLFIRGNRLVQEPVPEIAALRRGDSWRSQQLYIYPDESTPLEGVVGSALDIEIVLERLRPARDIPVCPERGESNAAGILLRSWNAGGEGSAAIVFNWETMYLETIFEGQAELETEDGYRRIGGPVAMNLGDPVHMRLLVDHSCIECYLGSGEVLSTRIYRGQPPPGADAGIDFVAYGGCAFVERWQAWNMRTIWRRELKARDSMGAAFETIYEPAMSG